MTALRGVLLLAAAAGCSDQSFVVYNGTVTMSDATGYSFDPDPNPERLTPVHAKIHLCEQQRCQAESDDSGGWGPIWDGTQVLDERTVRISFEAEGFEPFTYEARAPTFPTVEDGTLFLNVRMRPLAPIRISPPAPEPPVTEGESPPAGP
jgi:hypothetical protein